jgi:hypothetical protein
MDGLTAEELYALVEREEDSLLELRRQVELHEQRHQQALGILWDRRANAPEFKAMDTESKWELWMNNGLKKAHFNSICCIPPKGVTPAEDPVRVCNSNPYVSQVNAQNNNWLTNTHTDGAIWPAVLLRPGHQVPALDRAGPLLPKHILEFS